MRRALVGLVALLVVAGVGVASYLFLRLRRLEAFARTPYGPPHAFVVEIPRGSGPHAVARLLARTGAVSSAGDFYLLVRRERVGPLLKAGEYELPGPMTPERIIDLLRSGRQKEYRFTVPEGLRVDETLAILAHSELHLDLAKLQALARDRAFIRGLGVPADSLEGFLFPDTYIFTRGFTARSVLTRMVERSLEEYRKANAARKAGVKLNELETFTLASIIEKESAQSSDRRRISCVFHNRLRLHMKLQTDPTVLYAMMLLRGYYVNNITARDLVTPNPYNTYVVKGLPPGPIASPGAASLGAALSPIDCNDLYFVSRNDGTSVFCPTLKCHDRAVEKWQKEYFRNKRRLQAKARAH